jgi:hypothetical protein
MYSHSVKVGLVHLPAVWRSAVPHHLCNGINAGVYSTPPPKLIPAPAWNNVYPLICKNLHLKGHGRPVWWIKVKRVKEMEI